MLYEKQKMKSMRYNYWSCSVVAKFIQSFYGAPKKPEAATIEEWEVWRKNYKNYKFAYWFTETFLDKLQDVVYWPADMINNLRIYFINRFVDKTHYLPTRLTSGHYYELDDRMLHGLFETLVDFVECEKAHMELVCNSKENKLPWWYKSNLLRWKSIRSRELGMKYLEWEAALDQTADEDEKLRVDSQAATARETILLYTWWKDVRPTRPDPYDMSGWSELCNLREEKTGGWVFRDETDEEKIETHAALNRVEEIEQLYDNEDEEMMIRLIKIRKYLWT